MNKDTGEYSPTKSPETRKEVEAGSDVVDPRLIPGGAEPRTPSDQGMAGLDRDTVPSRASDPGPRRGRDTTEEEVAGD